MSYRTSAIIALVVMLLAATAPRAEAQSAQKGSIQGSLFSSTLMGDNPIYQNVDAGAGKNLQAAKLIARSGDRLGSIDQGRADHLELLDDCQSVRRD